MKVVALAGGVGGAKLAHGLGMILPGEDLMVIVNTGDDFEHLGLRICPDLDTVCYTLADLANPVTGWGRKEETWKVMETVDRLGGPTWFHLGDQDIGTHLERTRRLNLGEPLTQITRAFCTAWGIKASVLPMSDDPVATWVKVGSEDWLPFQEYFVHRQCEPEISGFRFEGADLARPAGGALEAIQAADYVIICPSNPWVSIGPILAISAYRELLGKKKVIAVSPIVGGKAIKGPAAKMYSELGIEPSALNVAKQYQSFLTGFVFDEIDHDQQDSVMALGIHSMVTNTVMKTIEDRRLLAEAILEFSGTLLGGKSHT